MRVVQATQHLVVVRCGDPIRSTKHDRLDGCLAIYRANARGLLKLVRSTRARVQNGYGDNTRGNLWLADTCRQLGITQSIASFHTDKRRSRRRCGEGDTVNLPEIICTALRQAKQGASVCNYIASSANKAMETRVVRAVNAKPSVLLCEFMQFS